MRKPLLILAAALGAALVALSGSDSEIEAFPSYGVPQQGWGAPRMTAQDAMILRAMMNAGGGVQRDNVWQRGLSGGNYDPVSGAGYVSVPGYGPVGHGM